MVLTHSPCACSRYEVAFEDFEFFISVAGHTKPASIQTTSQARIDQVETKQREIGSKSEVFRRTIGLLQSIYQKLSAESR